MRIMGLDIGSRRIGVAISDMAGMMAQPLTVIEKRNVDSDVQTISKLVEEYSAETVVIGLPVTLSGELGPQARAVLEYIEKLKGVLKVPIKTWDERLTTVVAERTLLEADIKRSRRKQVIDKVAAAVMLQGYLDFKRAEERKS